MLGEIPGNQLQPFVELAMHPTWIKQRNTAMHRFGADCDAEADAVSRWPDCGGDRETGESQV